MATVKAGRASASYRIRVSALKGPHLHALERAIVEIAGVLDALDIDYMLIGGIANAIWGEPRATIDVDVTIAVAEPSIPATIGRIGQHVRLAVADPISFVRQTRVLPVDTESGIRGDLIFALLPFEIVALRRTCRRIRELDVDYLEPLVRQMATSLERPEILERWRQWTRG